MTRPTSDPDLANLHAGFLLLLPRLEAHARAYFRHVRCPQKKDDLAAEAVAIAWSWYRRLVRRGKDPHAFAATFIHRALCQARSHRRLCGQQKAKDVLSPLAQSRHAFHTQPLPEYDTAGPGKLVLAALADNTTTPPDEQAAFRIDFSAWLASLTARRRRVALDLLSGERPGDVAVKRSLSPGRVSQLRRELLHDWRQYCGEMDPGGSPCDRRADVERPIAAPVTV